MADEAGMQRFVPRAAAGDERHLALLQRAAAHELVLGADRDDVRMCRREAVEAFGEQVVGGVDELLHGASTTF